MRILGHIHTLNDKHVIGLSLAALRDQTHPLTDIIVVDNGSTDGTIEALSSAPVTVLSHSKNLGTSGAVVTGLKYALDHEYDWVWLFDADSAPHTDALEQLLRLYSGLAPDTAAQTWLLASQRIDDHNQRVSYEFCFTPRGFEPVHPDPAQPFLEFHSTIWSGSLYRVSMVRELGLPSADYVLDWGEHEYGYRGKQRGFRAFLHPASIVRHNLGRQPGLHFSNYRLGPIKFRMREFPPIRCYYLVRNLLYFWLYEYHERDPGAILTCLLRIVKLTSSFVLRPVSHQRQLAACLRGFRDGLARRMERRY